MVSRPLRPAQGDDRRGPDARAGGGHDGRPRALRAARAVAHARALGSVRRGNGVLRSGVRRDRPRPRPGRRAEPGELARPARPSGGPPDARAGPGRLDRGDRTARGPRSWWTRARSLFSISCVALMRARRTTPDEPHGSAIDDIREGFAFVRSQVWLWGTFLAATLGYLIFWGPSEVLLPVRRPQRAARLRGRPRPDLRRRRDRGDDLRDRDGQPADAAAEHDVHLRRVDGLDARDRRLRSRAVPVAGHGRLLRVQRARGRGHDRLGDDQGTPGARPAARAGLELRLVHLDRAGAGLLRVHRPDRRGVRAPRRRSSAPACWAASSPWPSCSCRGCATSSGAAVLAGTPIEPTEDTGFGALEGPLAPISAGQGPFPASGTSEPALRSTRSAHRYLMAVMKSRAWLLYLGGGIAALLGFLFVPASATGMVLQPDLAVLAGRDRRRGPDVEAERASRRGTCSRSVRRSSSSGTSSPTTTTTSSAPTSRTPRSATSRTCSVYPCLVGGLLLLIRRRNPGRDRDSVIDSLIVAIGVGTMQWVFLMSPVAHDSASTLLQKLVGMALPVHGPGAADRGHPPRDGRGQAGPVAVPDGGGGAVPVPHRHRCTRTSPSRASSTTSPGTSRRAGAIFYLLWGAAALHPSMRNLSDKAPDVERRMSRLRLLLLGAASLIAPGVMLIQLSRADTVDMPVLIGASVMLFVLVVLRMSGLVRRQEQSTLREKALRNAGAALVTATNRESIYAATLQAARALVGDEGGLRLLVATEDDPDVFQVVAAAGGSRGHRGHHRLPVDPAPVEARPAPVPPVVRGPDRGGGARELARHAGERDVRPERSAVHEGGAPGAARGRRAGERPACDPRLDRGAVLPGRPGARQRPDHRDPADPPERGALLLAGPELLGRGHGRRGRLHDPLHEPVGRARARPRGRPSSRGRSSRS